MQPNHQKLIPFARVWQILTLLLLISLSSGCTWFKKDPPIETTTVEIQRESLNLSNPPPLKLRGVTWIIITPDNAQEIFDRLESGEEVLFGLTPIQYENLTLDAVETRNYIELQRMILNKYKEYYEPSP